MTSISIEKQISPDLVQVYTCTIDMTNSELYSFGTRVAGLFILLIMYVIGIIGNTLIIWTIFRHKKLRTIQNIVVAVLAISDLFLVGFLLPFNMEILIQNKEPSYQLCRFQAIITLFLFSCSIQFIMTIALCRYCKICFSHKFARIFTERNLILAVMTMSIVSALYASFLWFFECYSRIFRSI